MEIILIIVMFFLCLFLYKPGYAFFFFWLAFSAAVFVFVHPSVGFWGFLCYIGVIPNIDGAHPASKNSSSNVDDFIKEVFASEEKPRRKRYDEYSGSSYHPGGNLTYLPNGNTAYQCGNITTMSNKIRSVQNGEITYYLDDRTGKRLGRSVEYGNDVRIYFDDDDRKIGRSVASGSITYYFGDCFECR